MNLEPIQLEEGYLKRFFKNGYKLILKNIPAWIIYIGFALFISLCHISLFTAIKDVSTSVSIGLFEILSKVFIGVWFIFYGLEIAANVDYKTYSIFKNFKYIEISFRHTLLFIKENIPQIAILLLIIFILMITVFSSAPTSSKEQYPLIFLTFLKMNDIFFWGFLTVGTGQSFFTYPIQRMFQLEFEESRFLSKKSMFINPHLNLVFNGFIPIIILVAPLATFIFLLPLTAPMLSLMLYMAFREIFLNKKENEKEEVKIENVELITN